MFELSSLCDARRGSSQSENGDASIMALCDRITAWLNSENRNVKERVSPSIFDPTSLEQSASHFVSCVFQSLQKYAPSMFFVTQTCFETFTSSAATNPSLHVPPRWVNCQRLRRLSNAGRHFGCTCCHSRTLGSRRLREPTQRPIRGREETLDASQGPSLGVSSRTAAPTVSRHPEIIESFKAARTFRRCGAHG